MGSKAFIRFEYKAQICNPRQNIEVGVFPKAFGVTKVLKNWPKDEI
jgi:hypothetical protein